MTKSGIPILWYRADSLLHAEVLSSPLMDGKEWVVGREAAHTTLPSHLRQYETRSNDIVSATMLFCLVLMLIVIRQDRRNLTRRLKEFFFPTNSHKSKTVADASEEKHLRLMLGCLLVLLSALLFYFYAEKQWHPFLPGMSSIALTPIYAITILGYFACKNFMYQQVHDIFFTRSQQEQWNDTKTFLALAESFVLFPLTMIIIYADVSLQFVTYSGLLVIFLAKMALLLKHYLNFFRQKGGVLHFSLYLCALEIAPLLMLWVALVTITKGFTIYYY